MPNVATKVEETTVTIVTDYRTPYGGYISVCGNCGSLGAWNQKAAVRMECFADHMWRATVKVPVGKLVEYKFIADVHGQSIWESGANHELVATSPTHVVTAFREERQDSLMKTSLYRDVVYRRAPEGPMLKPKAAEDFVVLNFRVEAPYVGPHERLVVVGDRPALGDMDAACGVPMVCEKYPVFTAAVSVPESYLERDIKYTYAITPMNIATELSRECSERVLTVNKRVSEVFVDSGYFHSKQFTPRVAGTAVPLFSLRTQESIGIGDFHDLRKAADLCKATGMRILQLLPINDTTTRGIDWKDSYPYSPLSVFALHPIYAAIGQIAGVPKEILEELPLLRVELDDNVVDYEKTLETKMRLLHAIYDHLVKTDAKAVEATVVSFIEENAYWAPAYAAYKALGTVFKTQDFNQWPKEFDAGMTAADHQKLIDGTYKSTAAGFDAKKVANAAQFHLWVQSVLAEQLAESSAYCVEQSVALKGDIPIGVDPLSADVWTWPKSFNRQYQAGAPPDPFSEMGQNWGFPTYNYDEMSKDGFQWWVNRLRVMAGAFHAYRIDHILGFFRIWSVPTGRVSGLCGYFSPSTPIKRHELEAAGLWDIGRLTEPWLPEHFVRGTLGDEYERAFELGILRRADRPGVFFEFADEFKIEENVEKAILSVMPSSNEEEREAVRNVCTRYWRLTGNVILIQDVEDMHAFYPRFGLAKTNSFYELGNAGWQRLLEEFCLNYFYRWHDGLWRESAHRKFPAIMKATDMLVCGEDLGLLAPCVPDLMEHYGMLGLRVQRMPADPDTEFLHPADYDPMIVATPSTHDMAPMRLWWMEEETSKIQYFWNVMLGNRGARPEKLGYVEAQRLTDMHLYSPAALCVIPLQDLLAMDRSVCYPGDPADEQINVPAVRFWYWRWRMHQKLEDVIENTHFCGMLKKRVAQSGRMDYHA